MVLHNGSCLSHIDNASCHTANCSGIPQKNNKEIELLTQPQTMWNVLEQALVQEGPTLQPTTSKRSTASHLNTPPKILCPQYQVGGLNCTIPINQHIKILKEQHNTN